MGKKNRDSLESLAEELDAPESLAEVGPAVDAAPAPEAVAAPEPAPKAPKAPVPLAVFLAVSGRKPDQMAGFARWAKKQKLGPMPVAEWKTTLEAFDNRPV